MKKCACMLVLLALLCSLFLPVQAMEGTAVAVTDAEGFLNVIQNPNVQDIVLRGGVYRLEQGLSIKGRTKPLTIYSTPGEAAVLTNAVPLSGWQTCTINGVQAFVTEGKGMQCPTLFSEKNDVHVTRLPETGFYYVQRADHRDQKNDQYDVRSNAFFASDLKAVPANVQDVTVEILHSWVNDIAAMVSFEPDTGRIEMDKYAGRPIEPDDRYFLENVKESLDKSGEWCFDTKEDKIYYVPYSGETAENLELYVSDDAEFVTIDKCENITFENVKIADIGWTYSHEKFLNTDLHRRNHPYPMASYQGGNDVCGAVTVTHSQNISFKNCDFENIGCTAIRFFDGAKHCTADSCYFGNIGSSAVFIGGRFDYADDAVNDRKEYAEDINVTNCEIEKFGQRFSGSCGMILTYCDTANIQHNEIHEGYYSGISVGFTWLFGDNPTENISVRDNLIYDIGLHTLSDLGGIYLLGVQKGTVVSGNVIHDVTMYDGPSGYAGCGIYLDSGCQYMTVEKNLVFNCDTSGFNTTISRENVIRNNIFALCGESTANLGAPEFTEALPNLNSAFYNNIFLTDGQVVSVESLGNASHFSGNGNVIWDLTSGRETYFAKGSRDGKVLPEWLSKWGGKLDAVLFRNPEFTDAGNFDFTFKDTSEIEDTGFEKFDYTQAGTLKNTTVGLSKEGGQTPYNSGCKPVAKQPAKVSAFLKICQGIVRVLRKLLPGIG